MSNLVSGLLLALGGGGVTGFGYLVTRAFLSALKATSDVSEQKNRTIDRQDQTITRQAETIEKQDTEIDRLQAALLAARRSEASKDITVAELQAALARARGTAS